MGDVSQMKLPEIGLQTPEHEELLNIIDSLRSHGISQYIDIPQLIVCGDQSSGKSSVLEAISGLRFPTKDNLCTRFATELILRRGPSPSINVTIIPHGDRTEKDAEYLSKFKSPSNSLDDFADIVRSAEKAMGLDFLNAVFSRDILRVELCGPTQPNLTLVDLPGIFWAGDKSQSDDDAALVQSMVRSYMEKSRSIILAVVSAKSDLAMQIITRMARDIDPNGQRTLGIITKPDLLFNGSDSEAAFVKLAKNENIIFKLGWHVLKNRDFDTKDSSREERDASEQAFFESRVWSSAISKTQLGIDSLKPRLSRVLLGQILAELPNLVRDVEHELEACTSRLRSLGQPRSTINEQRSYLLNASSKFGYFVRDSITGVYTDSFFGSSETEEGYSKRLRAVAQNELLDFAETMRVRGHAQEIVEKEPAEPTPAPSETGPLVISKPKYLTSVSNRMRRNRGCELPGLFNPAIVSDLFFDQSKRWKRILQDTEGKLVAAARTSVSLVVEHICDAVTGDAILRYIIWPNMEPVVAKLHTKVEEVLQPHVRGHPITFNHYFTETLQKKRQQGSRATLAKKLLAYFGVDPECSFGSIATGSRINVDDLLDALTAETEADMDQLACIEAMNAMEAYYKA
ncbi:hypothetical protein A1O3_03804 [Capronia epimyces CBS 606.96]|uniref:Dynamin-type G domain-containing protein n=1 Tax=Capronia epimyces CBS 606.96 TaxID=1182542 RepID=W9YB52_9EURO|nr:uncharacterized protein A1O3_03804 [Capronia epimyces CBS 606.96]EXJ86850.1 hypothetical protein A1O3_03804 [Capronia epimyces CBS 606.96]